MGLNEALAVCGVLVACVTDIKWRRVPNWLTVSMVIAGFGLAFGQSGFSGLGSAFIGFLAALGLFLVPFAMGWLGGGDVKLFIALGALLGVRSLLWVFLYSAIAGGVMALIVVLYRVLKAGQFLLQLRLLLVGAVVFLGNLSNRAGIRSKAPVLQVTAQALRARYPYAVAVAIGTIIALFA